MHWATLTWYVLPSVESIREIKRSRPTLSLSRVSSSASLIASMIEDPDTLERGLLGRSVMYVKPEEVAVLLSVIIVPLIPFGTFRVSPKGVGVTGRGRSRVSYAEGDGGTPAGGVGSGRPG